MVEISRELNEVGVAKLPETLEALQCPQVTLRPASLKSESFLGTRWITRPRRRHSDIASHWRPQAPQRWQPLLGETPTLLICSSIIDVSIHLDKDCKSFKGPLPDGPSEGRARQQCAAGGLACGQTSLWRKKGGKKKGKSESQHFSCCSFSVRGRSAPLLFSPFIMSLWLQWLLRLACHGGPSSSLMATNALRWMEHRRRPNPQLTDGRSDKHPRPTRRRKTKLFAPI